MSCVPLAFDIIVYFTPHPIQVCMPFQDTLHGSDEVDSNMQ